MQGGVPNDGVQAVPGLQEELADRIDAWVRLGREGGEQLVPAREQQVEELAAHRRIATGEPEVLDDENQEGIPALEGGLPALEFLGVERSLRDGNGRRRRRQIDRDL